MVLSRVRRKTARNRFHELSPKVILLLILACAAWFRAPLLRYPFFADDYLFLDQARGHGVASILGSDDPLRNYWRPLSRQIYFWLIERTGESPLVAHAINLALFLGSLWLLYSITRTLAGQRAGLLSAALLALHEAGDVPILWSSGSQDLLAVTGGLGAIALAQIRRMWWAALCLACAVLSKETAAVTPIIALLILRSPAESWKTSVSRVLPLFLVLALWAPVWLWSMSGGLTDQLVLRPDSLPAVLLHLGQAFLGLQWAIGLPLGNVAWLQLLLTGGSLLAVLSVSRHAVSSKDGTVALAGLWWALLAAVPVVPVVQIWCSYYFLFAICGLCCFLGSVIARRSMKAQLVAVALMILGSQYARSLESFTTVPSAWGLQSHLTRFYFDRSMRWVARYLEDLRSQQPSVRPNSTLYFAGTPAFASWQAGNGALVRWVYRDSSIRSHYFSEFSLDATTRGDVLFFVAQHDSLIRVRDTFSGLQTLASGQMLGERFRTAQDALQYALELQPADRPTNYWSSWLRLALKDTVGHAASLKAAGFQLSTAGRTQLLIAQELLAEQDTARAVEVLTTSIVEHTGNPELHGCLAEVLLRLYPSAISTGVEALATRLLAPNSSASWRLWARVQFANNHSVEAYDSYRHYVAMLPESRLGPEDSEFSALLRRALPGGDLAQSALRDRPRERP